MVGPRRRAREIALQVLHVMDVSPELTADAALARRHMSALLRIEQCTAVENNRSPIGTVKTRNTAEQHRLASAGRPQNAKRHVT